MIGNDIVDWTWANRESNWQRKGFLAKLFTQAEQQLIQEADEPERMVWTLWCLKESVYKANVRITSRRIFAPQKIACELVQQSHDFIEGIAFCDYSYHIRASITPYYVVGLAFLDGSRPIFQEVVLPLDEAVSTYQSAHLYQHIRQSGASVLAVPIDRTCICKNELGVPTLIIIDELSQRLTFPISISHHGRYGAFVIDYSNSPAVSL